MQTVSTFPTNILCVSLLSRAHSTCPAPLIRSDLFLLVVLGNRLTGPIAGPRCPEGSSKLRFPDYVTMTQDGGKFVSPMLLILISVRG